jgi:hypothetical protein
MRIMSETGYERATEAFRRLLAEAGLGGQARVDAIVALSQRTVYVATWAPLHEGFRTLVNSDRAEALPVFTDLETLTLAASRFGWLGQDGQVSHREFGAREAFQACVERNMPFLVLDVASEHALEVQREELEPLLGTFGRRDSTGPFAAVGRISTTLLEAANRITPEPASRASVAGERRPPVPTPVVRQSKFPDAPPPAQQRITPPAAPRPGAVPLTPEAQRSPSGMSNRPSSRPPPEPPRSVSAGRPSSRPPIAPSITASSDHGARLSPVEREPEDALLDRVTVELKAYPEVEWASYCLASHGEGEFEPTIAVRIDPAYRTRINTIAERMLIAGAEHGYVLSLLTLDDPGLLREARTEGLLFYPWKRRTRPG